LDLISVELVKMIRKNSFGGLASVPKKKNTCFSSGRARAINSSLGHFLGGTKPSRARQSKIPQSQRKIATIGENRPPIKRPPTEEKKKGSGEISKQAFVPLF